MGGRNKAKSVTVTGEQSGEPGKAHESGHQTIYTVINRSLMKLVSEI